MISPGNGNHWHIQAVIRPRCDGSPLAGPVRSHGGPSQIKNDLAGIQATPSPPDGAVRARVIGHTRETIIWLIANEDGDVGGVRSLVVIRSRAEQVGVSEI